jgi:hypothetical protein
MLMDLLSLSDVFKDSFSSGVREPSQRLWETLRERTCDSLTLVLSDICSLI